MRQQFPTSHKGNEKALILRLRKTEQGKNGDCVWTGHGLCRNMPDRAGLYLILPPLCHVPANMPCVGTHKRDDGVSCQRQPDKCYYNLVGTSCQRQPLQCHQNWGWAPEMIDCCFERHSYKPKESCCASLLGGLCSHKTAGDSGMMCVTV